MGASMEATLLASMSADVEVRRPAQQALAAMHTQDRPAFFGALSQLLADTEQSPRVRQAASAAMKQAMASAKARPSPPALKRRPNCGEAERVRGRRHRRTKNQRSAAAADDPNDLKAVFEMLQGSVGSDEQMLEILHDTLARRHAENPVQDRQLPWVPGALLPVHQLQLELLQTLAEEERQASHLRKVGKQVQDAQLLEKLSLARAARTGFDSIGTVAAVRSPRAALLPQRRRKPAAKPLTADEAFAQALSDRQQQRPSATVTTWSARDSGDPRVREWLLNKEMQSTSDQTLDRITSILILTRQGKMSEDQLRSEIARHGPIPSAWLRQIRLAINDVAYTRQLERKHGNRQTSPPPQRAGLLGISIRGPDGEHKIEPDEQVGLLLDDVSTPRAQPKNQAKATLGDALMQGVREAHGEEQTNGAGLHAGDVHAEISSSSWVSKRRTGGSGGSGMSPSEAAAKVASIAQSH